MENIRILTDLPWPFDGVLVFYEEGTRVFDGWLPKLVSSLNRFSGVQAVVGVNGEFYTGYNVSYGQAVPLTISSGVSGFQFVDILACKLAAFNASQMFFGGSKASFFSDNLCASMSSKYPAGSLVADPSLKVSAAEDKLSTPHLRQASPIKLLVSTDCNDFSMVYMLFLLDLSNVDVSLRYLRDGRYCFDRMLKYFSLSLKSFQVYARNSMFHGQETVHILYRHVSHLWPSLHTNHSTVAIPLSLYQNMPYLDFQFILDSNMVLVQNEVQAKTLKTLNMNHSKILHLPPLVPSSVVSTSLGTYERVTIMMYACRSSSECDWSEWVSVLRAFVNEFSSEEDVGLLVYGEARNRLDLLSYLQDAVRKYPELSTLGSHDKRYRHIHLLGEADMQNLLSLLNSISFVATSCYKSNYLGQLALSVGTPVLPLFQTTNLDCMVPQIKALVYDEALYAIPCSVQERSVAVQRVLRRAVNSSSIVGGQKQMVRAYAHGHCGPQVMLPRYLESFATLRTRASADNSKQDQQSLSKSHTSHYPRELLSVDMCLSRSVRSQAEASRHVESSKKIVMFSTWLPTKCGIATFSHNLACSLLEKDVHIDVIRILPASATAVSAESSAPTCAHGKAVSVVGIIPQDHLPAYDAMVDFANKHYSKAILQYEFGIWGGECGSLALCVLNKLKLPTQLVIHTADDGLNDCYHVNLVHATRIATQVVVMSDRTQTNLIPYHDVSLRNVVVIPHGVPDVPFISPAQAKAALTYNWSHRIVFLTNGLIHEGKGLDLVVAAMEWASRHVPQVLYVIVGEPHPACHECIAYYERLRRLANAAHTKNNVQFINGFIEQNLLIKIIQAADAFVLPYRDLTTSNSGTLSMALASGKCIITTRFEHALSACKGRCIYIEEESVHSLLEAMLEVAKNDSLRDSLSNLAYQYARNITWDRVADRYHSYISMLTQPA